MLHTLNKLDDIELSYMTNIDDIDYRIERTHSLRSNIFYLVSCKQLVGMFEESGVDWGWKNMGHDSNFFQNQ